MVVTFEKWISYLLLKKICKLLFIETNTSTSPVIEHKQDYDIWHWKLQILSWDKHTYVAELNTGQWDPNYTALDKGK